MELVGRWGVIELRQARINDDKLWSTLHKATESDLAGGAGRDVGGLLATRVLPLVNGVEHG
jgi:hypothetical protein